MRFFILLLALLAPVSARAVDGVLEINHALALLGGTVPGDAAGYPVTLGVSGSYRLTSDLTQSNPTLPVIQVTATDVTIDLNGFAIRGSNTCTLATRNVNGVLVADSVTCTGTSLTGHGISGSVDGLAVRNGKIVGVSGRGILAGDYAHIENVQISHTRLDGIRLGAGGVVRNAVVTLSQASGILEGDEGGGSYHGITSSRHERMGFEAISWCSVTNSTANWNVFHGFDIRTGCTATGVSASRNGANGISSGWALLGHCNASWNAVDGLSGSGSYDACVMEFNQGTSVSSSMTRLGPSYCDGSLCP